MSEPTPPEELVDADDAVIGRAFRASLVVIFALAALGGLAFWLTGGEDEAPPTTDVDVRAPEAMRSESPPPAVAFTDVTAEAGIRFEHENGATGDKLLPETMGGGVAFLDHDGDGDSDLLFVNSSTWGEPPADTPTMALYANDGRGVFEDVTAEAGLDVGFYGMGVAVGDTDCDGDPDLLFTAVGRNRYFENRGGTFVEKDVGVAGADDAWSTCAAFFDGDGDGDLDLYVGNYVRWSREIDFEVDFRLTGLGRSYGPPMNFAGAHSCYYVNRGDGTFVDASAEAGFQVANPATGEPMGKALACLPVDLDVDGDLDLMVANDTVQKFLFENQGGGRFEEKGALYGVAFDRSGNSTGAMGLDGAWYRGDGSFGFVVGNFANEMSGLFVSQGRPDLFSDEAIVEGLGSPTRAFLTFGCFWFDYDLDGRLDLLHANGHLEDEIEKVQKSQTYAQPVQLFWNAGPDARRLYSEVDPATTGDLASPLVGRGSAYADIDADGDLDVVLTQVGGAPRLLRNDQALGHHWLRVRLADPAGCNRDAVGARVELRTAAGLQRRHVMPARGYLSHVEPALTFGLGAEAEIDSLAVTWPDGEVVELSGLAVDREHRIVRER